ncbi:MAG: pyruvate ferredoxin oxidoreductase subunit gamma [Thermoplasmata archaeon]|jgi:2-oxoacid:acceptor oxidoreductase gamma subunit (pyruvate/2-ketoisovalerate family)
MFEIRFHGRGGQGAVIASEILATAAFLEGKYVSSFPYFGVERRGAPVTAFTRIDTKPIRAKYQIYNPDHVVVLDHSLMKLVNVTSGLKKDGLILINTIKDPSSFKNLNIKYLATVNASEIALNHSLGSHSAPIVNTAILGAYAKTSGLVKIDSIKKAIEENLSGFIDENKAAAQEAYEKVRVITNE